MQVNKETSRKKPRLVRKKVKHQKHICYPAAIKNTMNEIEKSYKQYTPCTCEPVCGDQCPCFRNGNCCEIYCGYVPLTLHIRNRKHSWTLNIVNSSSSFIFAMEVSTKKQSLYFWFRCPKTCNNRFGGCNCTKGQCINRKCPCFSNFRECNPDQCRSCSLR